MCDNLDRIRQFVPHLQPSPLHRIGAPVFGLGRSFFGDPGAGCSGIYSQVQLDGQMGRKGGLPYPRQCQGSAGKEVQSACHSPWKGLPARIGSDGSGEIHRFCPQREISIAGVMCDGADSPIIVH